MHTRRIMAAAEGGHPRRCKGDTSEESRKTQELNLQRDFGMYKKETRSQDKISIRIQKVTRRGTTKVTKGQTGRVGNVMQRARRKCKEG